MNIAFFTESNFIGRIDRNNLNARTEIAWMISLNAFHCPITQIHTLTEKFDLGIVIIPKKNIESIASYPVIENMKKVCSKVAVMQEGPNWFFQDYAIEYQTWFYNILMSVDTIYCHNPSDQCYYTGLTNKPCHVLQSLMITDNVVVSPTKQESVMIGGNFTSWYNGFDSFVIAGQSELPIYCPSMGRRIPNEEKLGIHHLPYMNWSQWITELSKHKYAIHLMRTFAAGTFALNCSYLGIPCIGYDQIYTQGLLHRQTSCELGDLERARRVFSQLLTDESFYKSCSELTRKAYEDNYSESKFLERFNKTL
jgi:hypothetical protein